MVLILHVLSGINFGTWVNYRTESMKFIMTVFYVVWDK